MMVDLHAERILGVAEERNGHDKGRWSYLD